MSRAAQIVNFGQKLGRARAAHDGLALQDAGHDVPGPSLRSPFLSAAPLRRGGVRVGARHVPTTVELAEKLLHELADRQAKVGGARCDVTLRTPRPGPQPGRRPGARDYADPRPSDESASPRRLAASSRRSSVRPLMAADVPRRGWDIRPRPPGPYDLVEVLAFAPSAPAPTVIATISRSQ